MATEIKFYCDEHLSSAGVEHRLSLDKNEKKIVIGLSSSPRISARSVLNPRLFPPPRIVFYKK